MEQLNVHPNNKITFRPEWIILKKKPGEMTPEVKDPDIYRQGVKY